MSMTEFAPADGDVHTRWIEHGEEGAVMVREQFVGDIREHCIARHNEGHWGPSKDFRLMGSFPQVVVDHYIHIHGITFREWMHNPEHAKRMLNDPALADFRIHPGKV